MPDNSAVLGIDVGTSGVRVVAAAANGGVLAESCRPLGSTRPAPGIHEQNAADWWSGIATASLEVCRTLAAAGRRVSGVAVTSTSGTLVVTGSCGEPLRPAILYDDGRSAPQGGWLSGLGAGSWNSSYSLAKALWVRENEPAVWERARFLLHPADWIAGRLCGCFGVADYSNALKLGYDPHAGEWSPAVAEAGIPCSLLPAIVAPGQEVGAVCESAARDTGIEEDTPVLAGATDGIASLIASGARDAGDLNTTLGTTLVWKALANSRPAPTAGVYCHLHPSGLWAPGAASNTGPGAVQFADAERSPVEWDRASARYLPSPVLCYLLSGTGERFPFCSSNATAFQQGTPAYPEQWHAAQLQSLGFVERWGYEVLAGAGVQLGEMVYSTGAAARSAIFSQLRADIMGRPVARCRKPDAAFGAAILASAGARFGGDVRSASAAMTRIETEFQPARDMTERYDSIYGSFRAACRSRGYGS